MESRVPAWRRWALLGVEPPPPGAGRTAAWRFVRDLQVRVLILLTPFEILLIVMGLPIGLLALTLAGYVLGIVNAIQLTVKLRRG